MFVLIYNQLLSTATAEDINTYYYITNSALAQGIMDLLRRGREEDPQPNKRVRTWAGLDVFNELFHVLDKTRELYKLRHVSW